MKNTRITKRLIDVAVSLIGVLISAPLMLLIAIAILLLLEGRPIFFHGKRIGLNKRPFYIVKFRSMVVGAENSGYGSIAASDSRITQIGRILRKTKLDELPQFFNILKGDMSLVGPRPELWKYADTYTGEHRKILRMRPGLTDWATLVNIDEGRVLDGASDPDAEYNRRIRPLKLLLQLKYVTHPDLICDLRILTYTALRLLVRRWVPPEIKPYCKLLEE
jgi:lipopolysaccharide/colanic/teichoic acid biosynthesis glycosyltransferase